MSYTEQANQINTNLKRVFNEIKGIDNPLTMDLINQIIRIGQVAKFRCRSNVAYDNFMKEVFNDIAILERLKLEGEEFEVLKVKELKIK